MTIKLDSTNMVFMLDKNILSFLDLVDNSDSWYSYTARKVQEVILEGPSRLGNELLSLMRGQDPREDSSATPTIEARGEHISNCVRTVGVIERPLIETVSEKCWLTIKPTTN